MAESNELVELLNLKADPRPAQLLGEAGFLWSYLGRWTEAATVFNALIALLPNDPTGYLGLSEVHLMQNQYPQAHQQAQDAVKAALGRRDANEGDQATTARAYVVSAKALMHQGHVEQARHDFSKAVELEPNGPSGRHAADMLEHGKLIGLLK